MHRFILFALLFCCCKPVMGQFNIAEIARLNAIERSINGSPGPYIHPLKYVAAGRLISKEFAAAEETATRKAAIFGANPVLKKAIKGGIDVRKFNFECDKGVQVAVGIRKASTGQLVTHSIELFVPEAKLKDMQATAKLKAVHRYVTQMCREIQVVPQGSTVFEQKSIDSLNKQQFGLHPDETYAVTGAYKGTDVILVASEVYLSKHQHR